MFQAGEGSGVVMMAPWEATYNFTMIFHAHDKAKTYSASDSQEVEQ